MLFGDYVPAKVTTSHVKDVLRSAIASEFLSNASAKQMKLKLTKKHNEEEARVVEKRPNDSRIRKPDESEDDFYHRIRMHADHPPPLTISMPTLSPFEHISGLDARNEAKLQADYIKNKVESADIHLAEYLMTAQQYQSLFNQFSPDQVQAANLSLRKL